MTGDTLRWGVVSTAHIAVHNVIPAMRSANRCDVVAIASRDGSRAEMFANSMPRRGRPAAA